MPTAVTTRDSTEQTLSSGVKQAIETLDYNGHIIEKKSFTPSGNLIEVEVSLDESLATNDPRAAKVKVSKDIDMTFFDTDQPITSFDDFVDIMAGSIGKSRTTKVKDTLTMFSDTVKRKKV